MSSSLTNSPFRFPDPIQLSQWNVLLEICLQHDDTHHFYKSKSLHILQTKLKLAHQSIFKSEFVLHLLECCKFILLNANLYCNQLSISQHIFFNIQELVLKIHMVSIFQQCGDHMEEMNTVYTIELYSITILLKFLNFYSESMQHGDSPRYTPFHNQFRNNSANLQKKFQFVVFVHWQYKFCQTSLIQLQRPNMTHKYFDLQLILLINNLPIALSNQIMLVGLSGMQQFLVVVFDLQEFKGFPQLMKFIQLIFLQNKNFIQPSIQYQENCLFCL